MSEEASVLIGPADADRPASVRIPLVLGNETSFSRTRGPDRTALRVALLCAPDIIVLGLFSMLAPYSSRVQLTRFGMQHSGLPSVDLTLIDTQSWTDAVEDALVDPHAGAVVIFTCGMHPTFVREAIEKGCSGCIDKALAGEELVDALERIGRGDIVVSSSLTIKADEFAIAAGVGPRPGHCEGLSRRESEVMSMVTGGFTNQEIAHFHFISINTVKSYVRSAYRKIGADRRSQAVRWGIEHGMLPPG